MSTDQPGELNLDAFEAERQALARVIRDANEEAISVPRDARPVLEVADWLDEADGVLAAGWSRNPVATADFWPALAGENDRDVWAALAERDEAKTERDTLRAQRDAVLALHPKVTVATSASSDPGWKPNYASSCQRCHGGNWEIGSWPCATARALGVTA